jgi:hypothetical protein
MRRRFLVGVWPLSQPPEPLRLDAEALLREGYSADGVCYAIVCSAPAGPPVSTKPEGVVYRVESRCIASSCCVALTLFPLPALATACNGLLSAQVHDVGSVASPRTSSTCTTTLLLQAFLNNIRSAEDLPSAMAQTKQCTT